MLKHAVAEYPLQCDGVAAQVPSFCAIQSSQIPVLGDGLWAQHILPCMWHWNCCISSLLGNIAQFLNFRWKKKIMLGKEGWLCLLHQDEYDRGQFGHHSWKIGSWMTVINVLVPSHKDCSCRIHCLFSCLVGLLGAIPILLPPAASIRLTPTQLFWKHRQISWMIHWSRWPSCLFLEIC